MKLQPGQQSNTGRTHFKKGAIPWNKGKKNYPSGESHYKWQAENPSYRAVHAWIVKEAGRADRCSFNLEHKSTKFEWANISGSYLRDIGDYAQLCAKCHRQYDNIRRSYAYTRGGVTH